MGPSIKCHKEPHSSCTKKQIGFHLIQRVVWEHWMKKMEMDFILSVSLGEVFFSMTQPIKYVCLWRRQKYQQEWMTGLQGTWTTWQQAVFRALSISNLQSAQAGLSSLECQNLDHNLPSRHLRKLPSSSLLKACEQYRKRCCGPHHAIPVRWEPLQERGWKMIKRLFYLLYLVSC